MKFMILILSLCSAHGLWAGAPMIVYGSVLNANGGNGSPATSNSYAGVTLVQDTWSDTVVTTGAAGSMSLVAQASGGPYYAGWNQVPLPSGFILGKANWAYFYTLTARRGPVVARPVKGVLYLAR